MDKYEALNKFYSSFGLKAYEENSVPEKAKMPYITYEVITSSLGDNNVALALQIWFNDTKLITIDKLTEEISDALSGGKKLKCDDGYIVLYRGKPFAQNIKTIDKSIKCKYITVMADFVTIK